MGEVETLDQEERDSIESPYTESELPGPTTPAHGYHDFAIAQAILKNSDTLDQAKRLDQISSDIKTLEAQLSGWGVRVTTEVAWSDHHLNWSLVKRGRGKAWRIIHWFGENDEPKPLLERPMETRLNCASMLPDLVDRLAEELRS